VDQPPTHSDDTPSVRDLFPALRAAQSAYLGQIDSLPAPDRRTHELIRLVCSVVLRHPPGVERHAQFAAELGASWDDIVGSMVLTQPGFGLVPSLDAMPHARAGYERGLANRASGDGPSAPDAEG